MLKGGNQLIQLLIIVLIMFIITFNLKLLFNPEIEKDEWGDFSDDSDCKKPIIVSIEGTADVHELNMSSAYLKWGSLNPDHAKVLAYYRNQQSFLTIGIPSVKRIVGSHYLMATLRSIVEKTTAVEKLHTVVVVFLADSDVTYNQQVLANISAKYMDLIQIGFIQVVQATPEYYPSFQHLKRNFGDSKTRVQWRSKQVADFAFMFMYCKNLSEYYLQLEDDVRCARGFVTSIKKFVEYQKRVWAVLEFSELGFIGKLFKSADLPKLAHFMLTFYQEQPVDWLIRYFRMTMTQNSVILRKPTLFQHMGQKSSFDVSKDNKLKDKYFDGGEKKFDSEDPPAAVYTSMESFELHTPDLFYPSQGGYFWAQKPKLGDTIHLIFEEPQKLARVVLETGHAKMATDVLHEGTVEASPHVLKIDPSKKMVICADPVLLGNVINGKLDATDLDKKLYRDTKCITITVTKNQENWIVFNTLAVFVVKEKRSNSSVF